MSFPWSKKTNYKQSTKPDNSSDFQTLVSSLQDGVVIYDQNFQILFLNSAAEKITGLSLNETKQIQINPSLLKTPEFSAIVQIIFPNLAPSVIQLSESDWPQVTDLSLENPELKLRVTTIKIDAPLSKFIKVIRDRTREENILNSKSEFLNVTAHQLRTPLTALNWVLETLSQELKNDPRNRAIALEGLNTAKNTLKIINDLLNASQIESGRFGYSFTDVDISDLVQNITNQAKISAEQAKISLNFKPIGEPVIVKADAQKISMALANIIDNSIKYTPESGSINISLSKQNNLVEISISDTGVGIPQNEIQKIFSKFYRATNITKIAPNGSGLGLYIARNIIKNHGGEISINSEPENGTTVVFTLPTDPNSLPTKEITYEQEP